MIEQWPLPDFLTVILLGAFPIVELRGAIPLAFAGYGFSAPVAFGLAVLGNALVPLAAMPLLGTVSARLSERFPAAERFFTWLFTRTRRNHEKSFEKWKEFALVIFVAIPLPFTGAWTASLVAFVFGIPLRKAFLLIGIGAIIAGAIVTAATLGVINAWVFFL
ncbi:MAG: hypothetical protein A3J30_02375 [Candidatus Wildermuthbacteria bacterium RIFCSPLOWO2_02_FULL_47_9c]|uniref:Ligand-binding protein SH3 n=2 Tax=Parcubacteria group TaxID=1794811 RepID=A0A837IQZ1_9BACT|nr:MAG: hypothetical protein UY25_C0002G0167 [Candidatus Yanofskybacteria bacterium GW2011_GWC1_48_11]KKW04584.1 MAG: hypothetical protein UY38_C0001G0151 [Parcubacteria group bacterium GW2011_GWB1_49_12]KKW09158.1 MAG: hypothetical protein UY45_C0001G0044 [Parcubacteria group bacterium GW2011_GWA1_49_26]KKW13507.1 MAG: hypothetical protein UY53_C0012G0025 [Parcubacteria group bacterium GW2011_GWA2_50_10]OHA61523.1 MAG: hypothetical protein A2109_00840 [Candidatus Wildermuthbacteria bacterium G